jgi:hypothetical protein
MGVSVGISGRGVPPAAHDDARRWETQSPTAHNHDPRGQRVAGIRHWHLKTRTRTTRTPTGAAARKPGKPPIGKLSTRDA